MASFLDRGKMVRTILDFLFDNSPIICEVAAVVGGAFCQAILNVQYSTYAWWFENEEAKKAFCCEHAFGLVWGPVMLLVIGIGLRAVSGKRISHLEDKLASLNGALDQFRSLSENLKLIIDHHLYVIGTELGFGATERVSLYVFRINSKGKKEFSQCGRYSLSESLKSYGRSSYPLTQGVIGKAWDAGVFECTQLPDWSTESSRYINTCVSEFGFARREVKKLTMHPRYIIGYRIGDVAGLNYKSVIVIESMNPDYASTVDIKRTVDNHRESLFAFVKDFYSTIPSLSKTMERGF